MARPKSDVTISLKGRDGKTLRLNLAELIDGNWSVFRDGKKSKRLPYATSTDVANGIRQWLNSQKAMR